MRSLCDKLLKKIALKDKGLRIMILLRVSPLVPFNVFNYVAGVTSISLRDYAIGMIGILPGTLLYILLGSSAGSLVDSSSSGNDSTVRIISIVLGIVFAVLGVYATTYYAKKELNKILSQRREVNAAASTEGDVDSSNGKGASTIGNDSVTTDEDDVEAQSETAKEGDTYKNEENLQHKV
uniref:VTT domain-containing protein n=1 Tax=Ditylum brightwellii TaxID=49249 RepID=A0A7S4SI40_9STRA